MRGGEEKKKKHNNIKMDGLLVMQMKDIQSIKMRINNSSSI